MAVEVTKSVESPLDAAIILLLILLVAGILAMLAFVPVPPNNMPLFAALSSGVIGAAMLAYVNFRWGSSKGSQAKDATIASMAKDASE